MANKRLNTAYLLRESFGQLWSYKTEGWARKFFGNWKESLKWQRLKPYEKFAEMIENTGGVRMPGSVGVGFTRVQPNPTYPVPDYYEIASILITS